MGIDNKHPKGQISMEFSVWWLGMFFRVQVGRFFEIRVDLGHSLLFSIPGIGSGYIGGGLDCFESWKELKARALV